MLRVDAHAVVAGGQPGVDVHRLKGKKKEISLFGDTNVQVHSTHN